VFKRKANEVFSELQKAIAEVDFELVLNGSGKPKRGSFEIFIQKAGSDKKVAVWSGISKGPPRKDKFPDIAKDLIDKVQKA
jgi:hypothetical protein